MNLPSIFKRKTEEHIGQARAENPQYQVGTPIATSEVITELEGNPYMLSLNNMSQLDWEGIKGNANDNSKTGWSVKAKVPGVTRDPWTLISPKAIDGLEAGPTGKSATPGLVNTVELLNPSFKFKTPTIFGYHTVKDPNVGNGGTTTPPTIEGEIAPVGFAPLEFDPKTMKTSADGSFEGIWKTSKGLPNLNPDDSKDTAIDGSEGRGATGQSIRTGTKLQTNSSVKRAISPQNPLPTMKFK